MKKVFLSVLILVGTIFCAGAQDVIIKLDGSEIQAKVIEIDPVAVKYQLYGDLNGPTYVVLKSELFRIKYENGRIELFAAPVNSGNYQSGLLTGYWKSDMQIKAPYLYQDYRKNAKLVKAGWWMIGGGILLMGIGSSVAEENNASSTYPYGQYGVSVSGSVLYWIGCASYTAGIPVVIVGYVKRNRAKRDYFMQYGNGRYVRKSPLQSPHFELRTNGLAFVF